MSNEGKRTISRTVVYIIILLIPMLFILEAGLRLSPLHLYLTDDGYAWGKQYHHLYGWDMAPNYRGTYFDWVTDKPGEKDPSYRRTIAINSSGFRHNGDTPLEKPDNTFRIFTLGDSITFGWGVEIEDSFAGQLEKLLNESSSEIKYQVINAGIIGFTSYQGVRLLRHKLLAYDPDVIVVAYGGTNYVLADSSDKDSLLTGSPVLTKITNIGRRLFIYRGIREILLRMNKVEKKNKTRRVSSEDFRNDLRELIEISEKNNVGVVLMTIQSNVLTGQVAKWTKANRSYSETNEEIIEEHKKINNIIREAADERKVVMVDIAEKFNILKTVEQRELFYRPEDAWDDYHPNEEGHRVIAEELSHAINNSFAK